MGSEANKGSDRAESAEASKQENPRAGESASASGEARRRDRKKRPEGSKERKPELEKASARSVPDASELDRRSVLAALEAGLAEALPGVEVLDRDLAFEQSGRADLVAVDPLGRLVLVLVAGEDADRTVLEALDLLAYARENTMLLVRHIASRRVDPGLAPRTVVVDPACDELLAKRLGSLAEAGISIFGIRTLRSAAGERSYLMASGKDAAPPRSGEGGIRDFLEALPLPLREVGLEFTKRMARLDEELFATADRSTLVWRFHGEILARLECDGSRLTASVAPEHRPAAILGAADVEGILEGALARVVETMGDGEGGGDLLPDDTPAERGSREPILTREEIEAFQG